MGIALLEKALGAANKIGGVADAVGVGGGNIPGSSPKNDLDPRALAEKAMLEAAKERKDAGLDVNPDVKRYLSGQGQGANSASTGRAQNGVYGINASVQTVSAEQVEAWAVVQSVAGSPSQAWKLVDALRILGAIDDRFEFMENVRAVGRRGGV